MNNVNNVNNVNNFNSATGLVTESCFEGGRANGVYFVDWRRKFETYLDPSILESRIGKLLEVTNQEISIWISIQLTNAPPLFAHSNCRRVKKLPFIDT